MADNFDNQIRTIGIHGIPSTGISLSLKPTHAVRILAKYCVRIPLDALDYIIDDMTIHLQSSAKKLVFAIAS